jgi:hypothetical protein
MGRRKKVIPVVPSVDLASFGLFEEDETIGQILIKRIKNAGSFTTGVAIKPCVILWTDPERQWEGVINDLKEELPELYILGDYSPENRTGPAIWLKCIESKTISVNHEDIIPIFYLPGISMQHLNDAENCEKEIQPLVEYLNRGAVWHHPNGRDWTPYLFLSTEPGGLQLKVSKDESTKKALLRALPVIMNEKAKDLSVNHIDSDFINHLVAPDFIREILIWMNNPKVIMKRRSKEEWESFSDQSEREYCFHPDRDGEIRAAQLLTERKGPWLKVWERFFESPNNYPNLVKLLHKVDPPIDKNEKEMDSYPAYNTIREEQLADSLTELKGKRRDEIVPIIMNLNQEHGLRRDWVWARVQLSQYAIAIEHLAKLAQLTEKPLNASSTIELGDLYANEGWKVDKVLMDSLACCLSIIHEEPILEIANILYYEWIDRSAKNLQEAIFREGNILIPKLETVSAKEGRLILFVDGLRYDISKFLLIQLSYMGYKIDMSWDWSPIPSITQTAKYYVSPINHLLNGDETCLDLNPKILETGQTINHQRFNGLLSKNDIEIIDNQSYGDPNGKGWTESGTIDQKGHSDGWMISRRINQVIQDLALRIDALIKHGWKEVLIVTDHGWLMVPMSFDKADIPKNITDLKWGRCAVLKETSQTDFQLIPWFWSDMIKTTSPPGASCFRNGMQFSHGGISLQELVVPRILVTEDGIDTNESRISEHRWIGLRCQIQIENPRRENKVDIRKRINDPESSLIEGRIARETSPDGTISLPIGDPDNEGLDAFVVIIDEEGKIVHYSPTTIGG